MHLILRRCCDLRHVMPVALIALTMTLAAHAQEKPRDSVPAELQEVVITGSRIARPDLDRLQPTTVINTETFEQRGYTDVAQALQELPAFGVASGSAANQQGGFGGVGQAFVDLYSLGSQRTLTLVNGRRFVSSNTASLFAGASSPGQQVDLNVIPTQLIERVETISVGGAPIYGADAVSGTVNIILKKNFEGLNLDAQTGVSNRKDAWNYRASVLGGKNFFDDRLNVIAVAEFSKADGLRGTARKNYAQDLQFDAPLDPGPYKRVLTSNAHVPSVSTSGIPLVDDGGFLPANGLDPAQIGVTNPQGQILAFAPGSSALSPYNLGQQTGNPVFWKGGDGIALSQFSNLLAPLERINFDTLGTLQISDHMKLSTEGWLSETHGRSLAAQPAYNTILFGGARAPQGNFVVPVNNPFLSTGDQATIQGALDHYAATLPFGGQFLDPQWDRDHFYLSRASVDLESNAAASSQVLTRGVLALSGDFSVLERHYDWEVALSYGSSRTRTATPQVVFQNAQNALNATRNAAGNIVCAGTPVAAAIATGSSTCAPLNLFGLGSPSAAAIAYIVHDALAESFDTQRDATVNLSGDILKLPAGEWKGAVGFENRRESADFEPDAFYTGGFGANVASGVAGAYHTNELYAETLIPIIEAAQDLPALHQLEIEGAVRRVDNSIAGSATTWTGGLRWSPIADVQFRANKTKSIRAPAVTELFLPSSTANEFANDPCDKNYVTQGVSPARRATNCAAAGIDTKTFVSNVVNATAQGLTSGNAHLTSETADSKTFGVVLRPHWVSNLSLSVDYIEINLTNAIAQLNLVEIMNACYDSADYPNNPSCTQFSRNGAHQVSGFHDGFVNAGLLDFQGISVSSDYAFNLPRSWGRMTLRANYLDTRKLVQIIGSASPQNLAGELGGANPLIAVPKSKATIDAEYRRGPFSWYWQAQYYSGLNFDNANEANSQDIMRVNPWWLINSTLSYDVSDKFTARFIVDNVFNKEPPYPALAGSGGNFASTTSLYFAGIIGRSYLLSMSYRF